MSAATAITAVGDTWAMKDKVAVAQGVGQKLVVERTDEIYAYLKNTDNNLSMRVRLVRLELGHDYRKVS